MTVDDLFTRVRNRIYDIDKSEYTDAELIRYLNDAILIVHGELMNVNDSSVVSSINLIAVSTPKPTDFYKMIQNRLPLIVNATTLDVYGNLPVLVNYYKKPILVNILSDTVPYSDILSQVLEQIVSSIALNKGQWDTTEEKNITESIKKML